LTRIWIGTDFFCITIAMSTVDYSVSQGAFRWPSISCRQLATLCRHWESLTADGKPPARRLFSPVDLPGDVWAHLFLIEFLEGAGSYRLRLMGGYLVSAYGQDFGGRRLTDDEIPGISQTATCRLLDDIAATSLPQYYLGPTRMRFRDFESIVEQVLLPLSDETTGQIVAAIGAINYPARSEGVGSADARKAFGL